ncbi:MAG: permease [Planctomycetota bacterium]
MVDKLLLSFAALALGPLLVVLARRHAWSTILVDSFCVVTISGFALLHLLPECVDQAGWTALPLAFAGFLAPTLAERGLQRNSPNLRRLVLVLALLGMAAHDTLDGLFLHGAGHAHDGDASAHAHSHDVTAWAVILHRIPEGIGIWWIVPRTLGRTAAVLVMAVTILATLFGFFLGHDLESSTSGLAMLQALLAGSLLHVVFHAHIPAPRDRQRLHLASVAGAAVAAFVLWFVIHGHVHEGEGHTPAHVFLQLALESAPTLVLAYLLVGLCHAFLPAGWLARMTRGNALQQALRGVAIGLPLPVCSCGVVPIYRQLVQQGASLAAAIAFLVATPELEITAVLLTWQLMGPEIAWMRVAMAALLALSVGMAVGLLHKKAAASAAADPTAEAALPSAPSGTFAQRLREAIRFGYGPAVDNTASWILMGLVLSALMMPYVSRDWIAALPAGIDVPVAALIGLPLYVCATGSTPLAAILLGQGLSPGAVLALLLTGPATNITTFGMLRRLHGTGVTVTFAVAMWLGTIALGYAANAILPSRTAGEAAASLSHEHGAFGWFWLFVFGLLLLWSLLRQGVRPFLERLFESPANVDGSHGHTHQGGCCADGHDHEQGHTHAPGHVHDHGRVMLGTAMTAKSATAKSDDGDCCSGHGH